MGKKRKFGEGSVRLRKDGRWEGRIVIGYDDKRLPIAKSVLSKSKTECEEKLAALRETLVGESPPAVKEKRDITLGEWLVTWYRTYKKSTLRPNTRMSYEQRIYNHLIPVLGDIPLKKLTPADVQRFCRNLKENGRLDRREIYGNGLSDQTIRGCYSTLRAALDKAVEEKIIIRNPVIGCKLPPAKPREMRILSAEEMQRLLILAKEDSLYELLLLELATGLRRGEILALKWSDLDLSSGVLRVERQVNRVKGELIISVPKTKAANRNIILPKSVLTVLAEYRRNVRSEWMFPSPKKPNSPLDPASVRKRLSVLLERAGCKHVRFHDLRHTFCTGALEHGMDVKTLSAVIGHVSSATTLDVYAHITDEMRQSAAVKIDREITKSDAPVQVAKRTIPDSSDFLPYRGNRRKPGTGCISRINENTWEGRYSPRLPDGKRYAKNVYAHSEEECEEKLAVLIEEMKTELAEKSAVCG